MDKPIKDRPQTREEAQDMADAHADGWHTPPDGIPREGCPLCEDRPLSGYPRWVEVFGTTKGLP